MRCQEQSSIVLMIMSVMIQERKEIYLLGEFLSCTVNAVTVISITNSSEVLDTIATVRIGCWGELDSSGRSSWSGSEPEAGCRFRYFFLNSGNISSTQSHVARTPLGGVLIRRKRISESVVVPR